MSEDKFEEFLQREAQAYNAPPTAAPRDEMWAAIERSRTAARREAASFAPPRRRVARLAPWIGMAATLLIGVGIGRFAMDRGPASLLQDPAFTVDTRSAAVNAPTQVPAGDTREESADASRVADTPGSAEAGAGATPAAGTRDEAQAPVSVPSRTVAAAPAGSRAVAVAGSPVGVNPRESTGLSPTYEVASQRHLQRAEALVAVVAAAPRDPMMDSLTSLWARDVLSNTRLLLDSPVGDDPIRRRLLEDLENLLVQLVQRSGPAVQERELIDRTLQRTQLLTRLRTSASGT